MKVLCFVSNKTASLGGSIHLRASIRLARIVGTIISTLYYSMDHDYRMQTLFHALVYRILDARSYQAPNNLASRYRFSINLLGTNYFDSLRLILPK